MTIAGMAEKEMMMEMARKSEGAATPLRRVADIEARIKVIVEVSRTMNMIAAGEIDATTQRVMAGVKQFNGLE